MASASLTSAGVSYREPSVQAYVKAQGIKPPEFFISYACGAIGTGPTPQWTVSACQNCNAAFGKIEIALRDQLAICLVPNNPVAHAAIAMARANFNPLLAKTEIDARARAKRQRQLFAEASFVFSPPPKGALPFTPANLDKEGYGIKIPINTDDLVKVVQKWTRGVHFKLTGGFIEPDHEIRSSGQMRFRKTNWLP